VRVSVGAGGSASEQPFSVPVVPFDVRLQRLDLRDIELETADGRWQVSSLEASMGLVKQILTLSRVAVEYQGLNAEGEGQIDLRGRLPGVFDLRWQGEWPDTGRVTGQGHLEGDLDGYRVEHRISAPLELVSRGRIELQAQPPHLQLEGEWSGLRWPLLEQERLQSEQGHYRLQGPLDRLQIEVGGDIRIPEAPFLRRLQLSGLLQPEGLRQADLLLNLERGELALHGAVGWSPQVTWDLQLDGTGLDPAIALSEWPGMLQLKARVEGGIREREPWSNIALQQLTGTLRGRPITLRGEAEFSNRMLQLPELMLTSGDSRLRVTGRVDIAAAAAWDLTLQGEHLDPAIAWPEWPGQLDLQAGLKGEMADDGPSLQLGLRGLTGSLRGQPLSLTGAAGYDAGRISLEGIALSSGPNRLRLSGGVAETLGLDLELDAPDLAASWPGLSGRLQGAGRIAGTRQAPTLNARLQADALAYQAQTIGRLQAVIDWNRQRAEADLAASDLTLAGETVQSLQATLRGVPERHRAQLDLEASQLKLNMALDGGWNAGTWDGRLQTLKINHPLAGDWRSASASGLRVSADAGRLESLCLNGPEGRLCSEATWGGGEQQARVDLQGLPLKRLRPYMPDPGRVEGVVNGFLELQGPLGSLLGRAELVLSQAALVMEREPDPPLRLALSKAELKADATPAGVAGSLNLLLEQGGSVTGQVRLASPDTRGSRALDGTLDAALPDITPLELVVPGVSELNGRLEGALKLSGSITRPQVAGALQLRQGAARVPGLGLELSSGELELRSEEPGQLLLSGGVDSGGGRLQLEGVVTPGGEGGWPLDLELKGESVQLIRLPEAEVYASPDLRVSVAGERLGVTGRVEIPRARIEIRKLPESAVAVSGDEVIVGVEEAASGKTATPVIDARVNLRLGEAVTFSGFGLQSRLRGELDLGSSEGRYQANGELQLLEGRYKAYGQDLSIETGRLAFVGPADNPGLDVKATRLSRDQQVTAILDVQGTLRSPRVSVSSEPALPEEEALAYLVTGRGIGESGGGSAALLRQAALAKGLDKSQAILDQIAGGIGADEIRIEEGATLEETSLLLGKYLSPDLYVSYGVGLFDKQGGLMLRYRLSEHLRLEVQSGSQQGVDLFYDIERD
ncbi:MAG: translocation/assembly module TamB domain-containing protein, partial [Sedimenticola sp.]|nr:translocation/assembly module TamB domain-containing protein [Sedimenticola sp.]